MAHFLLIFADIFFLLENRGGDLRGIIFVSLCMIGVFSAFSADTKIAYINSERLRRDYDAFADAQAQFDKDLAVWEAEANKLEKAIADLKTEYEQQMLLLSDEKKLEKQKLIVQKEKEYQAYLAEIFGTGGKAERRNAELTKPLLDKINAALVSISRREGYDLVLDVAGGNIAYIDEDLDITQTLLEELGSAPASGTGKK